MQRLIAIVCGSTATCGVLAILACTSGGGGGSSGADTSGDAACRPAADASVRALLSLDAAASACLTCIQSHCSEAIEGCSSDCWCNAVALPALQCAMRGMPAAFPTADASPDGCAVSYLALGLSSLAAAVSFGTVTPTEADAATEVSECLSACLSSCGLLGAGSADGG